MRNIMLVDDEAEIVAALNRELRMYSQGADCKYPLRIHTYTSPAEALRAQQDLPLDVVISDYRMFEMDGVVFLDQMKTFQPNAVRIILSGTAELDVLIEAINRVQIFRYIPKPWHAYDVISVIEQGIRYRDLLIENQRLADTVRVQHGKLSRQEMELARLEMESPGITHVNWGADGSVILDDN